jgi:hypothetical protein
METKFDSEMTPLPALPPSFSSGITAFLGKNRPLLGFFQDIIY